jgi:DNA polymerase-1
MWDTGDDMEAGEERSAFAARGRYARNAMVQGAAAELFKVWAATVRARVQPFDARIVLCLHDELLLHVPVLHGDAVAAAVSDGLQEASHRWMPRGAVRFVADVTVIRRWSDAKA